MAIDVAFLPFSWTAPDGTGKLSIQTLVAMDAETGRLLPAEPILREPGALDAVTLLAALETLFAKHGKPRQGVVLMPGVWRSTADMLAKPRFSRQIAFLRSSGERLPEMDPAERCTVELQLAILGLESVWAE